MTISEEASDAVVMSLSNGIRKSSEIIEPRFEKSRTKFEGFKYLISQEPMMINRKS